MIHSKINLAEIQLDRAITLLFEHGDFVSAVTLAGASEEITRNILERNNNIPVIDKLKLWLEANIPDSEIHSDFYNTVNSTRNALKHYSDSSEGSVTVNKEDAYFWIIRAIFNYGMVTNKTITPQMERFINHWKQQNN